MTAGKLISRDEVLGGMSGRANKQAKTLLILIENRTASLVAQSRQAAAHYVPLESTRSREQEFLEAVAQERAVLLKPTIQDLERYSSQWAALVPDNPNIRAIVAYLLGQRYQFTSEVTPGLQAALGLQTDTIQAAYQGLYGQPLHTIFAANLSLADRLRWRWSALAGRLEELPPFWTAFALTVTETVGSQYPGPANRPGRNRTVSRGSPYCDFGVSQPGDDGRDCRGYHPQWQYAV